MHLLDLIDRWGKIAPDRLAHVSGGRTLTYGELVRRSDALAAHLARTLAADKSPVVVLGHKEPEMLIAFLGAVKAGHPYVPVDDAVPAQRVERIVASSGARLTLTPRSVADLADASDLLAKPQAAGAPARRFGLADTYYIIFTSGSTGEPKGVPITLASLTNFLQWIIAEQRFAEGETILNVVPYSFDVSLMDTHGGLVSGGTVFSITRDDVGNPRQLFQSLAASGATVWISTPSFAQMCLAEKSFGAGMLPRLKRLVLAGETLTPAMASQLLSRFPEAELWNGYGPTEATVLAATVRIDRDTLSRYSSLPIGHPMPGSRIAILDEARRPVPDGERGEIVIAGPHVSAGYLGRPDLTERAFFLLDGMRAYRTGDWGRYRDGMLFFEGRMDNQVKLRGYRIELADIEANLLALPGVRDAVVLPVVKQGVVDSLAACLILTERPAGSDFELAAVLKARLAERLPAYMIPRKFHFLDTFPANTNGKTDRRKLAESLA